MIAGLPKLAFRWADSHRLWRGEGFLLTQGFQGQVLTAWWRNSGSTLRLVDKWAGIEAVPRGTPRGKEGSPEYMDEKNLKWKSEDIFSTVIKNLGSWIRMTELESRFYHWVGSTNQWVFCALVLSPRRNQSSCLLIGLQWGLNEWYNVKKCSENFWHVEGFQVLALIIGHWFSHHSFIKLCAKDPEVDKTGLLPVWCSWKIFTQVSWW